MNPTLVAAVVFVAATVIGVLLVCALSVAASLFLIIEMDDPFQGLMKVSSAPIRFTIANFGK